MYRSLAMGNLARDNLGMGMGGGMGVGMVGMGAGRRRAASDATEVGGVPYDDYQYQYEYGDENGGMTSSMVLDTRSSPDFLISGGVGGGVGGLEGRYGRGGRDGRAGGRDGSVEVFEHEIHWRGVVFREVRCFAPVQGTCLSLSFFILHCFLSSSFYSSPLLLVVVWRGEMLIHARRGPRDTVASRAYRHLYE